MNDEDWAVVSAELAMCTLRIEYKAAFRWERACWRASVSLRPVALPTAATPTIIAEPPPTGDHELPPASGLLAARERTAQTFADDDFGKSTPAPFSIPAIRPPMPEDAPPPVAAKTGRYRAAASLAACAVLIGLGWRFSDMPGTACWLPLPHESGISGQLAADVVARRIVTAESGGDANARNARSSATGAGQFLDGTWLDMIRAYRPDLSTRAEAEILDLRYDPAISREMVARFAEKNAETLVGRCLPITPGTLYLAHFAGGAGAVAVLSAPDAADAAAIMAEADSTGRTTREMLVSANPFLKDYSVADLKRWADRKMGFRDGDGWQL
jgi:hypothetical protein